MEKSILFKEKEFEGIFKGEVRMWNKIDAETKIGGFFGLIAFVAILVEMSALNFSAEAVSGGIKDMAATMVAIMVLVVAVRKLRPRKEVETFHSTLEKGMERMCQKYSPLLNRAMVDENSDESTQKLLKDTYRYNLLTQLELLLSGKKSVEELNDQGSKSNKGGTAGVFVDIEKNAPKTITFYINKGTFNKAAKNRNEDIDVFRELLAAQISGRVNAKFSKFCESIPSVRNINVTFSKKDGLDTIEDAKTLIELIEFVLLLYTVKYN
jgi:hypothetical protein